MQNVALAQDNLNSSLAENLGDNRLDHALGTLEKTLILLDDTSNRRLAEIASLKNQLAIAEKAAAALTLEKQMLLEANQQMAQRLEWVVEHIQKTLLDNPATNSVAG
ncbi:MAG: hypothetical protein ACOYK8_04165 [Alphaproteobacteria bacterium]